MKNSREAGRLTGLHVLADDGPGWKLGPVDQARAAVAGGAAVIQLRVKHGTDREALTLAAEVRSLARESHALFIVNDRFDLALACEADGVHLGQTDLPPDRVPASIRARLWIGRSTHTPEEAARAAREPVDYVAFGPVFGTRSKQSPFDARGLSALANVVSAVSPKPVVAIGGIGAGRVADVIAAGARGVAVISAVAGADDPETAARELAEALAQALAGGRS